MIVRLLVGTALLVPGPLLAQAPAAAIQAPAPVTAPTPVSATPMAVAVPAAERARLRTGTEVQVRLLENLTTEGKKLKVGRRVRFETTEALAVQGVTVVPVGTPVAGELIEVVNKGMWGKSGRLAGRMLYMTVNGRQIRLAGAFDDKGVAGGAGAVAVSALVFLPAGFFMTGTSAKLPIGTLVRASVDEDIQLDMASADPAPLAIGAPVATGVGAPAKFSAVPVPAGYQPLTSVQPATTASSVAASAPVKLKAKSPSGYCYDVPQGYVGAGTAEKPTPTPDTPACRDTLK